MVVLVTRVGIFVPVREHFQNVELGIERALGSVNLKLNYETRVRSWPNCAPAVGLFGKQTHIQRRQIYYFPYMFT